MRVAVDDVRLFFDVEGCLLTATADASRALINDVRQHFRHGGCGQGDIGEHADAITCPTLILAGQDDPVAPPTASLRLAALLTSTSAQVEVFDGVGHGVFRQATQRAFGLLRAFLRQTSRYQPAPVPSADLVLGS